LKKRAYRSRWQASTYWTPVPWEEVMSRAAANEREAKLQPALSDPLCLFERFDDVVIYFVHPSKALFVRAPTGCEITFDPEKAFDYAPAEDRARLRERWEYVL
jgi:hypothetical protein